MNKEAEMCTCSTCGYQWVRGKYGGHSCASVLKSKLDALQKEKFVVSAGKYETPADPEDDGRNYKFIGEPKANLTEALTELETVSGYPFSEIEFRDANGKHWIVSAYPDLRPRMDTCKHCNVQIKQTADGHWFNTAECSVLPQYCYADPVHGSKLHEPK